MVVACMCAAAVLLVAAPSYDYADADAELLEQAPQSLAAKAKTALAQLEGKKVEHASKGLASTAKAALNALKGQHAAADATVKTLKEAAVKAVAVQAKAEGVKKTVEAPLVSASEVHKIMKTMLKKKAAAKKAKQATESKTDRMQDRILKAKNRLASLKLQKSQDFAKYEKSNEEVDDAKSKALEAHDEYQEDMERERSYKKRLQHLQQKLANHLTGSHARTDLNTYYAKLNDEAVKSIPAKIRKADLVSTNEALAYKHKMEVLTGGRGRNTVKDTKMDAKKSVSLKQFPQINVWDTHPNHKQDVIDSAEKKLQETSKDADRLILKSEQVKKGKH